VRTDEFYDYACIYRLVKGSLTVDYGTDIM